MDRVEAEVAVRSLLNRLIHARSTGDIQGFVECFSPDACTITSDGQLRRGREPLARLFAEQMASGAHTPASFHNVQLVHPTPGVVVIVYEGELGPTLESAGKHWINSSVAVLLQEGQWTLSTFHVTMTVTSPPLRETSRGWRGAWARWRQWLGG